MQTKNLPHKTEERPMIYQVIPRLFTNMQPECTRFGTLDQNGSGKFDDYTPRLLKSIKDLGVTHIWYTGIIENATKTDFSGFGIRPDNPNVVKGEAGSPYAIKDYYDVNPCLATDVNRRMHEFEALVERTHSAGLKVIIDFVPNHTARQYFSDAKPDGEVDFGVYDDINMSFAPMNNYYYSTRQQFAPHFPIDGYGKPYVEFPAKATGNDCFSAFPGINDWYETAKLNYGHDYGNGADHFFPLPDTWVKMLRIIRFWASKGVDGFRCDMVFMVPQAFWHWLIPIIKQDFLEVVFLGEIYDVALYRPFLDYACFDYLYDKVNLYDTLVGIETGKVSAACLTGCWQTVDGIGERMLNFLENHDEVRFGSKSYAGTPDYVVPSLVVSSMMGKGPFMVYFGQELGESAKDNEGFAGDNDRTSIFDYWSYDTMRRWYDNGNCTTEFLSPHEKWLRSLYSRVLHLCNECAALRVGDFFDLMYVNLRNRHLDPNFVFAFLRYIKGEEAVLVVANFSHSQADVRINFPALALDMSGIAEGPFDATDLLSGKRSVLRISEDSPTLVSVGGKNAAVLHFRIRNPEKTKQNINSKVS